jgi:glycosyltransferase involved in cell wall biosynthesis
MLVVLLAGAKRVGYTTRFTYRYSPEYDAGAASRLPTYVERQPLGLPDPVDLRAGLERRFASRPRFLRLLKALTYAIPFRQFFELWDIKRLYDILSDEKPELLHVNNGGFPGAGSCNAAAIAGRLTGTPVIYVVNNLAESYRSPLRWADYPIDRAVAGSVRTFVSGSTAASDQLKSLLKLNDEQVQVLPNGIAVREADETVTETRRRINVPESALLVLMIARLEKRKGHRYLLEAARILTSSGRSKNAVFVLEGDGPERAALLSQSVDAGIAQVVRFIPSEQNIANLYAAADVVVLPSVGYEDFPNTTLEAMAFSLPVVASRIAGIPEQVVDGVTGILVTPADPHELAEALSSLFSPQTRRSMGDAGRRRFEDHFTPDRAFDRYDALYRGVLSQSQSHGNAHSRSRRVRRIVGRLPAGQPRQRG